MHLLVGLSPSRPATTTGEGRTVMRDNQISNTREMRVTSDLIDAVAALGWQVADDARIEEVAFRGWGQVGVIAGPLSDGRFVYVIESEYPKEALDAYENKEDDYFLRMQARWYTSNVVHVVRAP